MTSNDWLALGVFLALGCPSIGLILSVVLR